MAIQPIPTHYAGHHFRSRLEAHWAVFFDSLGIRWEYEPQGYLVGERRRPYLPDFFLTDLNWWVEVKGTSERLDRSLLEDAVHPTHGLDRTDPFYMLRIVILGDIPRVDTPHAHFTISQSVTMGAPHGPMRCGPVCPFTSPQYGLHAFSPIPDTIPDIVLKELGISPADYDAIRALGATLRPACRTSMDFPDLDPTRPLPVPRLGRAPRLEAAYAAARTARFEHGETPAASGYVPGRA